MATPILNFAGDANVVLREKTADYNAAVAAHNVIATEVRSLRDQQSELQRRLLTPEFSALSVRGNALRKQAEATLAQVQASLKTKTAQMTAARQKAEKARTDVTFWQNQVALRNAQTKKAAPVQTNNRATAKPATPTPTPAPLKQATLSETPAAGTNGQAPAKAAPVASTAAPTTPTRQGGTATTPEQDQPVSTVRDSTTTTVAAAMAPLAPEEIIAERKDHRIRISAFDRKNGGSSSYASANEKLYGKNVASNILQPLWDTDGLMFPYTPTIQVSQDTSWSVADLEQTNFDILSFQKSSSASISVNGKFTVQNQREGRYLLAAIHFLRTVSKAYFGAQSVEKFAAPPEQQEGSTLTREENAELTTSRTREDGLAGLPPPVLLFSGYGTMMFNDLRVVVKSHSWSYDENADLIEIDLDPTLSSGKRTVWLPPLMTINITLAIQNNTDRVRDRFNLDEFRTGNLLKNRGWF